MNKITINNETEYKDYKFLKPLLKYALKKKKIKNAHVSVILVDEERIKNINRETRGIDKVTDTLAFAFEEGAELGYNKYILLGDIYICIPKMIEQATEYRHNEKRELAFLTVHGLLHLLGYNHETKEDEEKMMKQGEEILNGKGLSRKK